MIWEKINIGMVVGDIKDVLQYVFPALLLAIILFAVFCLWYYQIKGRMLPSPVLYFLFFWNACMMAYISIFCRIPGSRDRVDLTLFGFLNRGPAAMAFAVENVLFFIPFGFLLSMLLQKTKQAKRKFWFLKSIVSGMLVSIIIEGIQFVTKCGFVQAEDVLMNTVGAVVGSILAAGWQIFMRFQKKEEFESGIQYKNHESCAKDKI